MSLITIPNVFSAGAVIIASQHNSNFSVIVSDYNGNVNNDNIASNAAIAYSKLNLVSSILNADVGSGAAIAYSKLNLATSILNADISASAAIVDTKLAQITTASKVSGAAITALASLPSGAGIIPSANLPNLGLKFISVTSISAAATTGNISITSGNNYFVQYNLSAFSADDIPQLLFNADTGAHYKYAIVGTKSTGTVSAGSASDSRIYLAAGTVKSGASLGINGSFYIQQVGTASQVYRTWGQCTYDDNGAGLFTMVNGGGQWFNTQNATSFSIVNQSAATMTGSVYLYQLATS